jgi:ribosomal protein S18 acetylase RimI-like enzyme
LAIRNPKSIIIRTNFSPQDITAIINLHRTLYKNEYGYDKHFGDYVEEGLHEFVNRYNPETDCIWIADDDGKIGGSIVIAGRLDNEAQLRYFILAPEYRGQGIGKKLMQHAIDFCRNKKFKNVYLWTTQELTQAAALYKPSGFVKTQEVKSNNWGKEVVEERYDLSL